MTLRPAAQLLQRLSRRERRLLAGLALIGLPLLAFYGAAEPLARARATAEAAARDEAALAGWVAGRAAEFADLQARANESEAPSAAPVGISGVEQSLEASGLRGAVTRLSNRQDGQLDLSFDAVRFSALMAWLEAAESVWGYRLTGFRIEAGEAGDIVAAEFSLGPGGAP